MRKKIRLIEILCIFPILAGCVSDAGLGRGVAGTVIAAPTAQQTEMLPRFPTSTPEETAVPTPNFLHPCVDITNTGLPNASPEIRSSHILYVDHDYWRNFEYYLGVFSLQDGSRRKLDIPSGYLDGIGFLQDGIHYVLTNPDGVYVGNIENNETRKVQVEETLLSNFEPYSYLWQRIQESGKVQYYPGVGSYRRGDDYSPDGTRNAVYNFGDPAFVIRDVEKNTSVTVMETPMGPNGLTDEIGGAWTKDSSTYIFYHLRNDPPKEDFAVQVFSVDRDGNNLRPLTQPMKRQGIRSLQLSPDERKVVFLIDQLDGQPTEEIIGVINRDNLSLKYYYPSSALDTQVFSGRFDWSPDGKMIAYVIYTNGLYMTITDLESGTNYCIESNLDFPKDINWK